MTAPNPTPMPKADNEELKGLFYAGAHLAPVDRAAYYGFAVCGTCVAFVTSLVVVIEIATSPRASVVAVLVSIVGAAMSFLHLVRFGRAPAKPGPIAWGFFFVALAMQLLEVWLTITDRTAQIVFSTMGAIGAIWLLLARSVCASNAEAIGHFPVPVRLVLAILAWFPIPAAILLF